MVSSEILRTLPGRSAENKKYLLKYGKIGRYLGKMVMIPGKQVSASRCFKKGLDFEIYLDLFTMLHRRISFCKIQSFHI